MQNKEVEVQGETIFGGKKESNGTMKSTAHVTRANKFIRVSTMTDRYPLIIQKRKE